MNNFQITIQAVDKATATVRKINNSFSQLARPVSQMGKSTKALGRELGLPKVAASLGNVAKNARSAAKEISKIGAPVLALVGGGSLIGIAALATQWARLGYEVARTSETLGLSASTLQSLRGAAEIAGVSASDLTGGLKSLGDTMEDALFGRNQQALAVLNRLGITIHKTAGGAIDTARGFNDLAGAIARIKSPQVQGLVARTFGLEALLPLLRQGPAAIEAYQRKVRELGAVMSPEAIRRAENFGIALNYLKTAGQGLKNTIGDALIPAFQPLIEQLTQWIMLNRTAIGEQVGKWAKDLADWIKSIDFKQLFADIRQVVADIKGFVEAIGGWKVAAAAVVAIMAGPLLLAITNVGLGLASFATATIPLAVKGLSAIGMGFGGATTAATGFARALGMIGAIGFAWETGQGIGKFLNWLMDKAGVSLGAGTYNLLHPEENAPMQTGTSAGVVDFFMKKGWTRQQAVGIAANLKTESGFNTNAVGDNGNAFGVAQWHSDRQANFYRWAGKSMRSASLDEQLAFVNYELTQGTEKNAGNALRGARNERDAAAIISRLYERPAAADREAVARANTATQMNHQIEISLHGLPPGVGATARKPDGSSVPVKVAGAMPGVSP